MLEDAGLSDHSYYSHINKENLVCHQAEQFLNDREKTLTLIELFKKYKPKLGSFEVKNMKKMWELIARDLSNMFKVTISATKCENRWKVLQRNYKTVVDNNNKTGRGRKVFQYEEAFDEIYGRKTNIKPPILLSSSETFVSKNNEEFQSICESNTTDEIIEPLPECRNPEPETAIVQTRQPERTNKRKRSLKNTDSSYKKRNEILVEMKNDLKNYYDKRLEQMERRQNDRERRTTLFADYVQLLKKS